MLAEARLNQILDSLPGGRLAIAFSGGGDSTALVHFCRTLKPAPLILIVDHALRVGSKSEAENAARFAKSLGLETRLLTWDHDKPTTGLQEKARRARYGLMGEICRAEGISYLLTGHTQDDQVETLFMRYERNTGWRGAAGMARQSYAPVWPELAKVTLVRPLLETTRAELRAYSRHHDLGWTEDPSNENEKFERVRTRHYLSSRTQMARQFLTDAKALRAGVNSEKVRLTRQFNEYVDIDENGLALVSGQLSSKAWEYLLLAAGGADRPISEEKLQRVHEIAAHPSHNGTTLGGARLRRHSMGLVVGPDPGPYVGRNDVPAMSDIKVNPHSGIIWGGRFDIKAGDDTIIVKTLNSLAKAVNSMEDSIKTKKLIGNAPPGKGRFTSSMPFVFNESGKLVSSIFENRRAGIFHSLIENRLKGFLV